VAETQRRIVTLVGVKQAQTGFVFLHEGPARQCKECQYYSVCMKNLEPGRVYRVLKAREKTVPCKLHLDGAQVVEVVESDVEAALDKKCAIPGVIVTFSGSTCPSCESQEKCRPHGLVDGDRCKVLEVRQPLTCPAGRCLVLSILRRVPPASS